ncbi:hypothetical protein ACET9H_06110 [Aeromonas media]
MLFDPLAQLLGLLACWPAGLLACWPAPSVSPPSCNDKIGNCGCT